MRNNSEIIRRVLGYLITILALFGVACVASVFSCWSELYEFFGNEVITLISLGIFIPVWGVVVWFLYRLVFGK